jgi:hypothetical protein
MNQVVPVQEMEKLFLDDKNASSIENGWIILVTATGLVKWIFEYS